MLQMVVFKIYPIIKTLCFNFLPWISNRSSYWELFLEINLNQKILKLYTSWVHWKNQCILTIGQHALLWNNHEYQNSADMFLKNIFNKVHDTDLFSYSLKYIRKPEGSWWFQVAWEDTSAMKWFKSHMIFNYLFCYLYK